MKLLPAVQAHRIETLSLSLSSRGGTCVSADQQGRCLHELILPLLGPLLDRLAPPQQVLRLERLELHLGRLSLDDAPERWRTRLEQALALALARALPQSAPPLKTSALELTQFLHFLQHGSLPWSMASGPGSLRLSLWLESLARRQGALLWRRLQALPDAGQVLERLSRISPPQGLQALLAARQPDLAQGLTHLDEAWLAPLQHSGRLGAYQAGQLRQRLRVTALRALWGLRGPATSQAWREALFTALRQDLRAQLGEGWQQRLPGPRSADVGRAQRGLDQALLAAVLAPRRQAGEPASGIEGRLEAERPSPASLAWAGLRQLMGQAGARSGRRQRERVRQLLATLSRHAAAELRERLLRLLRQRRARRRCSELLDPEAMGSLMGLLGVSARSVGAGWADSLRQTALRLQSQCAPTQRPRLGRLQALLMEASLAAWSAGRRLPDSHSGWQALWAAAWARWQRDEPELQRPVGPPPSPEGSGRQPPRKTEAAQARRLQNPPSTQAERGWSWAQRLRLAQMLETPQACLRWLRRTPELQRWRLLKAQFGQAVDGLKRRLQRLLGLAEAQAAEPAPAGLTRTALFAPPDAPRLRERLWLGLCRRLFVLGEAPEQLRLGPELLATAPGRAAPTAELSAPRLGEPIWVDDAGQVLLAVYAQRLFARFELLDESGRQWRSETARAHAVACLQYLVRGAQGLDTPDEHRLPLSKLLCGASPETLLAPDSGPEPARQAELEGLLQALIAHWAALGQTSPQALRESFLQRGGRLVQETQAESVEGPEGRREEPARWRLRVEGRAFDVLLDRLPWSYGLIRLPWMSAVLHVDWR
ncbi:MAG: contractile injection system tape measure protein [Roseateles asaccharophilus]|uniref:contractile injection system tape measure protein n=1 Tax=Roseateles asaccharophilus TaxID=582607 RepID=UPI00391B09B9